MRADRIGKEREDNSTPELSERQREKAKRRAAWLKENSAALDDHAAFIERVGVFSNGLRRF